MTRLISILMHRFPPTPLLRLLPSPDRRDAINRVSIPKNNRVSAKKTIAPNPETDEICTRLNDLPEVLTRAYNALGKAGWRKIRGTDYWSRPGGKPGKVSAVFNRYEAENRMVFTVFTTNGTPFETKGYSPLGVLAILEFGGDFEACINALKGQYL